MESVPHRRAMYPKACRVAMRAGHRDTMSDQYTPRPEHQFSFGLWTVRNRGRDPFGDVVRPALPPNDAVAMLAEAGAWGGNLHDNVLVPIHGSSAERDRILQDFTCACRRHGAVAPMPTADPTD